MKKNLSLLNKFSFCCCIFFVVVSNSTYAVDNYNVTYLGKKSYPYACSSIWGYSDTINNKEYALVGTYRGLSIVDITNTTTFTEVAFIPGSKSSWRELKTYSHYAYVVHDVSDSLNEGLIIVDLQYLPDSVKTYSLKSVVAQNIVYKLGHTVTIDEKGFLYLNGGDTRINGSQITGTTIFDLKPNPINPTYIGKANLRYVHDCFVRNDILYQAHSNSQNTNFSIWNIQNRSNPILIQDFQTPFNVTHNIWLSDDSKSMFVTHESESQPIEVYNITDLNNIQQLQTFKNTATELAIAHNVHIWNDYLIVPHYTRGLVVFDASIPDNIVRIGYYDTSPYGQISGNPFHGAWGAYPYFKNGKVVVSDIEAGLFVLQPTYIRAARIQGVVTDTNTTQVLAGVTISFADTANSVLTSIDGIYKTGSVKPGLTRFKAEKTGYITKYFYATLVNGSIITVDVKLRQTPIEVKISAAFCENKSYTLPNGMVVSEPGIYYTNYLLPSGKDSIIKTTLTELPASYTSKTVHMCDGDSYQLPDGSFTSSEGTFYDTLQNSISCDSIITTYVYKHPEYSIFKEDSFSLGNTYTLPDGNTTTTGGIFVNNLLTTTYGCDSVITVDLKISSVTGIRNNTNDIQLKFAVSNNTLRLISKANITLKELILYNPIGEIVKTYTNPENMLYLPALPKGIYIIRAITKDDKEFTGKISIF